MCGIAGFVNPTNSSGQADLMGIIDRMTRVLKHRGPDDTGLWKDERFGVALGHTRLAVIDLSEHGHQPMESACGRYVVSFNGEIYNFQQLRKELNHLNHEFRGNSDTEVLLASVSHWGLRLALERFNGMFAFALWDRKTKCLHLARDRIGKKPIYFGWCGKAFVFGSELKALRQYPGFNNNIDRNALSLFFQYQYVPAPYSIYSGIYKVFPGTYITVNVSGAGPLSSIQSTVYWSMRSVAQDARGVPSMSVNEKEDALLSLLKDSVKIRGYADVPLGAFLSGGIDSSLIVALMAAECDFPVNTFTIGFYEKNYNEAKHAKEVAQYLGTHHTEHYVSADDARAVIPRLPELYDEPFGDSSQIPTFLISQMAKKHLTVALTGDGGDEFFGGYPRYSHCKMIWKWIDMFPNKMKNVLSKMINLLPVEHWDTLFKHIFFINHGNQRNRLSGDRLKKINDLLVTHSIRDLYQSMVSHRSYSEQIVAGAKELPSLWNAHLGSMMLDSDESWMMYADSITYLPDDVMVKTDRASMGVGLELRSPLLDYRVVEFAWGVPVSLKMDASHGKKILKRLLHKYIPPKIVDRPKMGFGIPVGQWLRGPLREWASDLLSPTRLKREGYLHPKLVCQKWNEHVSGTRNWQYLLWDILAFQSWLEYQSN